MALVYQFASAAATRVVTPAPSAAARVRMRAVIDELQTLSFEDPEFFNHLANITHIKVLAIRQRLRQTE